MESEKVSRPRGRAVWTSVLDSSESRALSFLRHVLVGGRQYMVKIRGLYRLER